MRCRITHRSATIVTASIDNPAFEALPSLIASVPARGQTGVAGKQAMQRDRARPRAAGPVRRFRACDSVNHGSQHTASRVTACARPFARFFFLTEESICYHQISFEMGVVPRQNLLHS